MKVENPVAFSFIMQDDLYLLNTDKKAFETKASAPIVETADEHDIETVSVNFNYFGSHKKGFLIIVHYPEFEYMHERHLAALESTLKRLDFSLEDVAILNIARYDKAPFEQLTDFFTPQKLLILGANALPAGIGTLVLNKLQQLNNYPALFTFSFDEMMDSNENKKAFWEQMKQL